MIRVYQHGDHAAIAEIFSRAVHEIASQVYTPEQCEVWASREINYDHWQRRCELKRPFVAVENGRIAGFLELDPDGHIDCAYINPDFQRRGIMTALVRHAVETCFAFRLTRVHVEASLCIRPLLEKVGFKVIEERTVTIRAIGLVNYRMELLKAVRSLIPIPKKGDNATLAPVFQQLNLFFKTNPTRYAEYNSA